MNYKNPLRIAAITLTLFFVSLSCNKIDWHDLLHSGKPSEDCNVSEYHLPFLQEFNLTFPLIFKKYYDASGKNVEEIDFSFWNAPNPYNPIPNWAALVIQKGQHIFLLDKINVNSPSKVTDSFTYKNNRLYSINEGATGISLAFVDTLHYDNNGNIISFRNNFYQYDQSRQAKQQYYMDDFVEGSAAVYVLFYLGLFPEVTSPTNIRTHVSNSLGDIDISRQHFDAGGKLISYDYYGSDSIQVKITWNCK
jgi:hypothetical protein